MYGIIRIIAGLGVKCELFVSLLDHFVLTLCSHGETILKESYLINCVVARNSKRLKEQSHTGMKLMSLEVQLLDKNVHDRGNFECRDVALNDFLKRRANKEHAKHLSNTYVLVDSAYPPQILGYFTLSNNGVAMNDLPEAYKKHLPNYSSIPTTLLARMARDQHTRPGFGEHLLKAALKISLKEGGTFFALEVVAKNQALVSYYESYGFIQLLDDETHLFLPRATFEKLVLSEM